MAGVPPTFWGNIRMPGHWAVYFSAFSPGISMIASGPCCPVRIRTASVSSVMKILPSPKFACAQNSLSSIEHLVNWDFTDDGLYFYLRDKVDIIFLATIYFLMPLLQTATEHLADGHAQHTDFIEGFHQVIEFAGTGNDFDFGYFHSTPQPFFAACMTVLASISLEFFNSHHWAAGEYRAGIATLAMLDDIETRKFLGLIGANIGDETDDLEQDIGAANCQHGNDDGVFGRR